MASGVLENLGKLHIVTGRITWTSGTPTIVTNDNSITAAAAPLTDNGAGDVTLTYAEGWLSQPYVAATAVVAASAAASQHVVSVVASTTSLVTFQISSVLDTGAGTTDVAAIDDACAVDFIIVGLRNN